jgi:hypothetical protein
VGPLSLELLERSIEVVVRRHEALRTRIVLRNDGPYQHVEADPLEVLSVIDLSGQPAHARHEASRLAQEFFCTHVDLTVGPLFEAKVWKLGGEEHVLVLLVDHIVADGISSGIIAREVWECYRRGMLGQSLSLPQLPVQFPDYAVWQARTRLAWMEKHAEYWRQHLRGASPTAIPADSGPAHAQPTTETIRHIPFGDELTAALRGAARRERALLSVFVLAAYAVVLSAWCRTEDLLVSFASHARHRPALRDVVGFLANALYLRIAVRRDQTFDELLAQVKQEVASALEHRDFDRVPELLPGCATAVGFNWQSTHSKLGALDHFVATESDYPLSRFFQFDVEMEGEQPCATKQIKVLPFVLRSPGSPTNFIPVILDTPSTLLMMIRFEPNSLAPGAIERFGRSLSAVAYEVSRCSSTSIASLLRRLDMD